MKILLTAINAKYIHSNLAVYSLKAYTEECWNRQISKVTSEQFPQIELAEYTINNRMEDILKGIYKKKPDIIAFSCYVL